MQIIMLEVVQFSEEGVCVCICFCLCAWPRN